MGGNGGPPRLKFGGEAFLFEENFLSRNLAINYSGGLITGGRSDALKEKTYLENLWDTGKAPWKIWSGK